MSSEGAGDMEAFKSVTLTDHLEGKKWENGTIG
jgi:hypothetical protein